MSRKEGNRIERGEGDKTSLLEKVVMDLLIARCRVTSGSCLGMLEVEGVGRMEMVTAARCSYPVVRDRSWTTRKEWNERSK